MGVTVAPAASTEEAVVDAENIVSLWGLPERKFVTIRATMPIRATASAIRGGETPLCFIARMVTPTYPSQKYYSIRYCHKSAKLARNPHEVRLIERCARSGIVSGRLEIASKTPTVADEVTTVRSAALSIRSNLTEETGRLPAPSLELNGERHLGGAR